MKRIALITGVTGFIGWHVANYFQRRGWDVIGIGKQSPANAPKHLLNFYYQIQLPSAELSAVVALHKPDVCIHCAGQASVGLSVQNPLSDFQNNTIVTFELLEALRINHPSCRFVLLSSAAVYGNPSHLPIDEAFHERPISPYGFHKWQCELTCQEFSTVYGIPTAIARIFSAYGPGLRRQVLWDICQKALSQPTLNLFGTGHETRDFIYVQDIAQSLFLIATESPCQSDRYNVACGEEITIHKLAELLLCSLQKSGIPIQFNGISSAGDPLNWRANVTKLKELGFRPTMPIEKGVQNFVQWFLSQQIV